MAKLGLERHIVDASVYKQTVSRFRREKIRLPRFAELAEPAHIPAEVREVLAGVDPDAPDPRNLFRVHWYNATDRRGQLALPDHVVLPRELTGVAAPILVAIGTHFPMIRSHKVLAAYGCLAPRVITGQFDPTEHRAVWPSTGNYCRGGVAISRIMDCRGVAVLPEGMSQERFEWLRDWVREPEDVIRTPGTESNVKEVYDKCAELEKDPRNIIFNQFCEFGNHLAHYLCTGRILERLFESCREREPDLQASVFVSATGSAGTLAAGDHLKELYGTRIAAVEALECPTLLYNGYGEHNIQGIGDKHVPYIHNVLNTDFVLALSDESTDALNVLFNTPVGREYLVERRGIPEAFVSRLDVFGLSSIANVLAAIKMAKYLDLGENDVVLTVATDGAELYRTEAAKATDQFFPQGFDAVSAGEVFGEHLRGVAADHLLELSHRDRKRVFNLGYFTWVEQQGVTLAEFDARKSPSFWHELRELIPAWDEMIDEFNARTGMA